MKRNHAIMFFSVAGMAIFLSGLYSAEFIRINTRFALFIAEMKQYGIGLFPTIYDKPYTDYPSTMIFMMYLTSLGGNCINMLTAVLPTAAAAVFTLIFTYLLGERVMKNLGSYGAALCLLSFEFLSIARNPGLDMFVAAATVACVYVAYTAILGDGQKRLWWIPVLLIGSFAIRGPLGIVVPAAAVVAVHLSRMDWKRVLLWGAVCGVTGGLCLAVFVGLCLIFGGKPLVELFLFDQVIGRMDKSQPLWYYFTNAVGSFALTYPLALAAAVFYGRKIFALPRPSDSKELGFMRLLVCWALLILIGMSIPGTKHLRYIVAAVPAMGLIAGWIFLNPDQLKVFEILRRIFFVVSRYMPFVGLAGLLLTGLILRVANIQIGLPVMMPGLMLVGLCLTVVYTRRRAAGGLRDGILLAVAVGCMAVTRVMIVDPIENFRENSRTFAVQLDLLRGQNEVWFYSFGPDSDEFKYLVNIPPDRRFVGKYVSDSEEKRVDVIKGQEKPRENAPSGKERLADKLLNILPEMKNSATAQQFRPIFNSYGGLHEILAAPEGTLFLTRKKRFDAMPEKYRNQMEMVLSGQLGHQECVAFKVKKKI